MGIVPAPTPTGTLPQIEIWFTRENRPEADRITTFKLESGQNIQAHIWAKGPRGARVYFDMCMVTPDGKRQRFGPPNAQLVTDPEGKAVHTGMGGPPPTRGAFRFEAIIGTATVGSTTITVQ